MHQTNNKIKKRTKNPSLRLTRWDVRNMRKGLSDDLQGINDSCETTVIDRVLNSLNIDVAAVHETRIPDSGFLKKELHLLLAV